jgi:probable F420-dependent oxidoreductase
MAMRSADAGQIGVWTYQLDLQPAGIAREAAAEIEALGFRTLWISEARRREILTNAALLLGATSVLSVATGIASIYARDPLTASFGRKTLAEAFPGRFMLGLGVSHRSIVEGQRGHAYGPAVETMRSYLEAMAAADYQSPDPGPANGRIVLAALGPKMLELARDLADGAHPYHTTPEHTRSARVILGPGRFLAPEQSVVFSTDPAQARAIARGRLAGTLRHPAYVRNLLRLGFTEADLAGGGSDRLVDGLVAHGYEAAIAKRLREHLDAGADHVAVQILAPDDAILPRREWRLLAESARLACS